MDFTRSNVASSREFSDCTSGLYFRFRLGYKKQNDADHREHAERSILAVPHLRLPHQEPFSADAEKNNEPHE